MAATAAVESPTTPNLSLVKMFPCVCARDHAVAVTPIKCRLLLRHSSVVCCHAAQVSFAFMTIDTHMPEQGANIRECAFCHYPVHAYRSWLSKGRPPRFRELTPQALLRLL